MHFSFRPLIIALAGIASFTGAAEANVITTYNLNMTAQVSSYSNAVHGDYITVTGQFLYDNTLGKITSTSLLVNGNLQASNVSNAVLNTAVTSSEDAFDLFASSADSNYQISFQFVNTLSLNQFDAVANQPNTDGGDARFYDAYDGYQNYHIGYFGVTGGATPVPEPASYLLFGLPLLGLAFTRRRAAKFQ